ncbi:MAG: metallophosphoesterase family protein [Bacillota bacterium]|jgi:hypothetical protein
MKTKQCSQRLFVKGASLLLVGLMILFTFTDSILAASRRNSWGTSWDNSRDTSWDTSAIVLTPGADISELNITWYSTSKKASLVQVALKSAMQGSAFPDDASSNFYCNVAAASSRYYSNKAVVRFLAPNTEYVYRLGDGAENWTSVYNYTTRQEDCFSFLAMGDPQIGARSTATDKKCWVNAIAKACKQFPDAAFLMSTGDQVQTCNCESQFTAFFAPTEFTSLPVVSAVGNHDNGATNHGSHYYFPNQSNYYGVTSTGSGDYYFTYGNALFMVLNTNCQSCAGHRAFIQDAVAANPDSAWKIVMFHHDIYGSAYYSVESSILNLRASLFPIFDDYAIDIVITGHDHSYTRSYPLKGDIPQSDQQVDRNGYVVNPAGTVYYTLNSASGSKYYDLRYIPEYYAAARSQLKVPTFSYVTINGNSLTFKTYRQDTMEEVDSYAITKSSQTIPKSF